MQKQRTGEASRFCGGGHTENASLGPRRPGACCIPGQDGRQSREKRGRLGIWLAWGHPHGTGLGAQSLELAEKTKVLQVPDSRNAQTRSGLGADGDGGLLELLGVEVMAWGLQTKLHPPPCSPPALLSERLRGAE